ncbi:MAG: hypothetical protein Fur0035_01930 [Anaerolineales bacterium]
MAALISLIGSSGVGKTTLARALAKSANFTLALEQHAERPFQTLLEMDTRYALANQMDYLLLRAEQEAALRQSGQIAVLDGGLEMDYHIFTRLFAARALLSPAEAELCRRLYDFARARLPAPELFILLEAPPEVIRARLMNRQRINIARPDDIPLIEGFLADWLRGLPPERLLRLDVSTAAPDYADLLPGLLTTIRARLGLNSGNYETEYIP